MSSWDINAVFRKYRERLFHFVRQGNMGWDTADDIVQDTFVRVVATPALPEQKFAQSYLYRTARNLVIDHHRRERIVRFAPDGDDIIKTLADDRPSLEQVIWSRQELRHLQTAINNLPKKLRIVFILARIEGDTYAEIGRKLNIPTQTAFSRMVRALSLVQEHFEEMDKNQQGGSEIRSRPSS